MPSRIAHVSRRRPIRVGAALGHPSPKDLAHTHLDSSSDGAAGQDVAGLLLKH